MTSIHALLTPLLLLVLLAGGAAAQDEMSRAKELYASASYEEALSLLDGLGTGDPEKLPLEAQQFRAFCLLALQRTDEAKRAIEGIYSTDPMFRLDETQASPRVQATFRDIRRAVLPAVVQRRYADAKAAYDRKDPTAAEQFDRVLALLDDPDMEGQAMPDFRTIVGAFRDLSRATAAAAPTPPPAPVPAPSAMPAAPPVTTGGASASGARVPPAAGRSASPTTTSRPPATGNSAPAATNAGTATPTASTGSTGAVVPPAASGRTAAPDPATPSSVLIPAVAVTRPMPPWVPARPADAREIFSGEIELAIDDKGNVTAAKVVAPIYPNYDQQLLAFARRWKFTPATRDGSPIASIQVVPIRLQATQR